MFTIVFVSFHSEAHINRLVSGIDQRFNIIVIENSKNDTLKRDLENKYKNVKVLITKKNLGLSGSYNLAIKESKTNLVFLNPSDVVISNKCLIDLEDCVKQIKDFAILSPTYDNEKVYKNYEIWNKKITNFYLNDEKIKKYKIKEVDFIDNDFIINKEKLKRINFFDENFFLYFETMDLCKRVKDLNFKIYVCDNIKFTHFGSQSVDLKFSNESALSRSWHYNWSKFYYFKKHSGTIFALRKIFPNLVRSIKKMIISKLKNDINLYKLSKTEFLGIAHSVLNKPSCYRPFEEE